MNDFTSEEMDTLCRAIAHRRSMGIARYQPDKPVDPCLVERMLRAADWAPSHGDTEPWRFTVFMGESRRALGEAFGEIYKREVAEVDFRQDAYEANCNRVWAAPVWIAIGLTPALKPDGSLRMTETEELLAVACAVQNMHLVASAMGLAGMWHSKGQSVHPHIARFLGLETPSRLLGFFYCGWPAIPWPEGERRPLAEKCAGLSHFCPAWERSRIVMQPASPCTFCCALQAAQEGRFQDALCMLDVVLDTEPVHHQARLHRAKLYALTGRPQDAVDEFRALMGVPGCQVEVHLNLTGVYLLLGMYDDAMQHLRYVRICQDYEVETPDLLQHWRN